MSRAEPDDPVVTGTAGITCDNCGAKWRLPASWKGPNANCQRCGCTIDARAQLDAGTLGRTLAAGARPAQIRARGQVASRPQNPTARSSASTAKHGAPAAAPDRDGERARAPRDERRGAGSPLPWIFAGCALCVLGAIAFVASR